MDVNKADAHTIDDDIIEVIVAIDTNPSKKSKPINSDKKEHSALSDLNEGDDDDEESSEEEDHEDNEDGDEPDWKSLCEQLLQAISVLDPDADEVVDSKMSDEEMLKAIDVVLDGKSAPEDKDPFSSYQNMNYGKKVAAGLVMDNDADLEGMGYDPGEIKSKKQRDSERTPKKSMGFKHAAQKAMGMNEEPEDDEEDSSEEKDFDIPEFDNEKEDDGNGKELFQKGNGKHEEKPKGKKGKGFGFPIR